MIIKYAPTTVPIFTTDLTEYRPILELAKEAIFEQKIRDNGIGMKSNVKANYVSHYSSHEKNGKFIPLKSLIEEISSDLVKEYMVMPTRFKCHDLWGAEYNKGDYTVEHGHYPAGYSAVCYIDLEDTTTPIIFEKTIAIFPVNNMLLLFPGMLRHNIPKTIGKRIIVACNMECNIQLDDSKHNPNISY
jgi:hypothetical protein